MEIWGCERLDHPNRLRKKIKRSASAAGKKTCKNKSFAKTRAFKHGFDATKMMII